MREDLIVEWTNDLQTSENGINYNYDKKQRQNTQKNKNKKTIKLTLKNERERRKHYINNRRCVHLTWATTSDWPIFGLSCFKMII